MAYTIPNTFIQCGDCIPECPTGAIQMDENNEYWVEPGLCNRCEDIESGPKCVNSCLDSLPVPLPIKKGRYKSEPRVLNTHNLFADGHNNPIASSMVIWEARNLLAKGSVFPWQTNSEGHLYFERQVKQGKGKIEFRLTDDVRSDTPEILDHEDANSTIESMDIRAACIHLIFAALVTKLTLIKSLVQQPCKILATINWPRQGKIDSFSISEDRIWHLVTINNHFQKDSQGYKHLVGMTFRIKAGNWSKYFLNKQGYKKYVAYYQYGTLPKFLLTTVMTTWHQHEGAVRMMLWLLFKTKMGKQQRITIPKLMYVAYGEAKVKQDSLHREKRKRLLRRFESDLEVLNHYQIKPVFDPVTYPSKIQPLWARLAAIPDGAEEAMEFWIKDGCNETSITDAAPPGKWNLLMKARILHFELPSEWDKQISHWENKKQRKTRRQTRTQTTSSLSAEQILTARKRLGMSQRQLAQQLGKSQSWIRDIENSRFSVKPRDLTKLRKILELEE